MLVSVGLAVRNGERTLAESIESLLAQDVDALELIISDNASDDATEDICRGFAAQDDRVLYVRQVEDVGAAANFNAVLHLARGEAFSWAAHDDRRAALHLRRCVEALADAPDAVVAQSWVRQLDAEGRPLPEGGSRPAILQGHVTTGATPIERFRASINNAHAGHAMYGVLRTDALRQTPGMRSMIGCDYLLAAELALQGQFIEVPEVLIEYRTSTETIAEGKVRLERMLNVSSRGARFRLARSYLSALNRAGLSRAEHAQGVQVVMSWLARHSAVDALRAPLERAVGPDRAAAVLARSHPRHWLPRTRMSA